jgi:hypothetical protein
MTLRIADCGLRTIVTILMLLVFAAPARAERYALIVTGAAGGDVYDQKYSGWRTAFTTTLRDSFKYVQCSPPGDFDLPLIFENGALPIIDERTRQIARAQIGYGSAEALQSTSR